MADHLSGSNYSGINGNGAIGLVGPKFSKMAANQLANEVPTNSVVNRGADTATFHDASVSFAALVSGSVVGMYSFENANLANPTVTVPVGSGMNVEVVNADGDTPHGLEIPAQRESSPGLAMMTGIPSFSGSILWFLGTVISLREYQRGTSDSLSVHRAHIGIHILPPGHATKAMADSLIVAT